MSAIWHVIDGNGQQQGPYTIEQLQEYYNSGNINQDTQVWAEGWSEWFCVRDVDGIIPDDPASAQLPIAELPEATIGYDPAPGLNVAPQVSSPLSAADPDDGLPTWIPTITAVIAATAVALFFLPWVGFSTNIAELDLSADSTKTSEPKIELREICTQSAFQAITKNVTSDKEIKNDFSRANLLLVALIVISLGLILALVGTFLKNRMATTLAQLALVTAAILASFQMANQFPLINKLVEAAESDKKALLQEIEDQKRLFEKVKDGIAIPKEADSPSNNEASGDEETDGLPEDEESDESGDETDVENEQFEPSKNPNKQRMDARKMVDEINSKIKLIEQQSENAYKTSFKAPSFICLILLGLNIILLVVTMTANSTPSITSFPPQGGAPGGGSGYGGGHNVGGLTTPYGTSQQGQADQQQPYQPGQGIRFH